MFLTAPCTRGPLILLESTQPRVRLPPAGVAEKMKALSPQAVLSGLIGIRGTYRLTSDVYTERPPHTVLLCGPSPLRGLVMDKPSAGRKSS